MMSIPEEQLDVRCPYKGKPMMQECHSFVILPALKLVEQSGYLKIEVAMFHLNSV